MAFEKKESIELSELVETCKLSAISGAMMFMFGYGLEIKTPAQFRPC